MIIKTKTVKWTIIAVASVFMAWASVRLVMPEYSDNINQIAEAKIASFDIAVSTIGTLDAEQSYIVSSTIKGELAKIIFLIDEGALIKKGDTLVEFDSAYFEEEILRLTGELRGLESSFEARKQILEWEKSQAEGSIKTAEFDLDDAKQEYNRYLSYINDLEELGKKGFKYPNEIYQAKKKVEQLFAKKQRFETSFEQIKKEIVYKIAAAAAELEQVKNNIETTKTSLDKIREELKKAVVKAPFSGIVVHHEAQRENQKRKPRIGDTVWQNQPILYLPDITSMIVKTLVREVDLHKITKGQRASIQVDAYPKMVLSGKVDSIGVMASDNSGEGNVEKNFQVIVSIDGQNMELRPGMTARVIIEVDKAKNILTVPVQAVFSEHTDRYCYVADGKDFNKFKVEIGRQNEDFVEIVTGLTKGEMVSLVRPTDDEIK
ncbi:MAG: efflux RND transporter periplasmic adaptor subunit [Deltaproteobacteria bacterium]|nr:efflux RND transporter periplasmic adaptor subunit [Deltaproteobacteria bacterium]